jgi:Zn-dependent protease
MVVLMAGPLPGILIGMICAMIFSHNQEYIYYQLALLFIFLNVFNLLPVSPLDGGQMLETLFFSSQKWVQVMFIGMSAIIIAFLAWRTKNYALLLIVAFLLIRLSTIGKKKIAEETDENTAAETEEITIAYKGKFFVYYGCFPWLCPCLH